MDQYRKSPRAKFHDYDGGDYFITICTKNRIHFFGDILNGSIQLSQIGLYTYDQLFRASDYCPNIIIPVFTVMPNHIHALISLRNPSLDFNDMTELQRAPNPCLRSNCDEARYVPLLSRYISSFKGAVTKYAKRINPDFGWHSRYHDHIIRNNRDRNLISSYILTNHLRWKDDCFFKTP